MEESKMKMKLFIILLILSNLSISQVHHGISIRKTNKGSSLNYCFTKMMNQDLKSTFRTGLHIENYGSGFQTDNYTLVEIPIKQISYLPISGELNYTLFSDSVEASLLPMLCIEAGTSIGLGRLEDTFSNRYDLHPFGNIGIGAEFSYEKQKLQISARYYQSEKLSGNILLDFTIFLK